MFFHERFWNLDSDDIQLSSNTKPLANNLIPTAQIGFSFLSRGPLCESEYKPPLLRGQDSNPRKSPWLQGQHQCFITTVPDDQDVAELCRFRCFLSSRLRKLIMEWCHSGAVDAPLEPKCDFPFCLSWKSILYYESLQRFVRPNISIHCLALTRRNMTPKSLMKSFASSLAPLSQMGYLAATKNAHQSNVFQPLKRSCCISFLDRALYFSQYTAVANCRRTMRLQSLQLIWHGPDSKLSKSSPDGFLHEEDVVVQLFSSSFETLQGRSLEAETRALCLACEGWTQSQRKEGGAEAQTFLLFESCLLFLYKSVRIASSGFVFAGVDFEVLSCFLKIVLWRVAKLCAIATEVPQVQHRFEVPGFLQDPLNKAHPIITGVQTFHQQLQTTKTFL